MGNKLSNDMKIELADNPNTSKETLANKGEDK